MPPQDRRVDDVVIVSNTAETLDGLQRYLRDAGVSARCVRDVGECIKVATSSTIAFVLFPDDFPCKKVILTLASLAKEHPNALPVLVTARPDRFEDPTTPESVLIVPRPVWAWTILDAIRAHRDRRPSHVRGGRKADAAK
jgi:DNA-binding response OmpR family regulator